MASFTAVDKPETSHAAGVSPTIKILPESVPARKPAPRKISVPVQVKDVFKDALTEQNRVKHGPHT